MRPGRRFGGPPPASTRPSAPAATPTRATDARQVGERTPHGPAPSPRRAVAQPEEHRSPKPDDAGSTPACSAQPGEGLSRPQTDGYRTARSEEHTSELQS